MGIWLRDCMAVLFFLPVRVNSNASDAAVHLVSPFLHFLCSNSKLFGLKLYFTVYPLNLFALPFSVCKACSAVSIPLVW